MPDLNLQKQEEQGVRDPTGSLVVLDAGLLMFVLCEVASVFTSSAAPFEGAGLDRVRKRPAFGAGAAVFVLEPVVPFRLGIGVVDQSERRVVAKPLLLAFHDRAVLAQKGAHITPQKRLQRREP